MGFIAGAQTGLVLILWLTVALGENACMGPHGFGCIWIGIRDVVALSQGWMHGRLLSWSSGVSSGSCVVVGSASIVYLMEWSVASVVMGLVLYLGVLYGSCDAGPTSWTPSRRVSGARSHRKGTRQADRILLTRAAVLDGHLFAMVHEDIISRRDLSSTEELT